MRKTGEVEVRRDGRTVIVVRGDAAAKLARKLKGCTPDGVQQLLARATGNYKRGNERDARRKELREG